ncbi:hypothetical protein BDR06DRAFT_357093 [Suillus hirtellus]|nr:hypothetical protein BDR06DRAFT_357093 [Suillus hirtellus]
MSRLPVTNYHKSLNCSFDFLAFPGAHPMRQCLAPEANTAVMRLYDEGYLNAKSMAWRRTSAYSLVVFLSQTPPLVYRVWFDLHWNSGAKTATATAELLERQNISIKTHGKHLTISVHLKRSENHKKGGYTVQQHVHEDAMVTVRSIA